MDGQDARGFNPRPPLLAGESLTLLGSASIPSCFNPRPPLLAGESHQKFCTLLLLGGFNPRPPLLAGESAGAVNVHAGQDSFNPRPPLLAGESRKCPCAWPSARGFNPRPPLLAGESRGANGRDVAVGRVSIHARHCWRANPPAAAPAFFFHGVSIHARHCWRANPSDALYQSAPLPGFNPRPPLLAGESWLAGIFSNAMARFNPRPPLLAGESLSRLRLTA